MKPKRIVWVVFDETFPRCPDVFVKKCDAVTCMQAPYRGTRRHCFHGPYRYVLEELR